MDATTITRVLFSTPNIHVYTIPPLTSTKGFLAASWTAPPRPTAKEIFTARLRVVESSTTADDAPTNLAIEIRLEDSGTGDLFAAAPYTSSAVVQAALDSARFFAIRVQGEGGMKATLGIGFEDRSPAFDFGIALTEARKLLGWEGSGLVNGKAKEGLGEEVKRDFSLKEGEKIHVQVGGKSRRVHGQVGQHEEGAKDEGTALFSIAPPPAAGKAGEGVALPPPPPPKAQASSKTAQDLGFDDGEFGEFQ
ncbi:hypothetical protein B0A48_04821 [Cryoendolithus antarcticus]|uniref:NECAP PHear domain-containing protein n=1 Tax=Cryoendolithus antarcticus TaxID=1507870 RepID=A0A1V8TDH5_9PEZI|nr:hypothetical protein B0A48_04821 [Cryoendolithus antarcticus]